MYGRSTAAPHVRKIDREAPRFGSAGILPAFFLPKFIALTAVRHQTCRGAARCATMSARFNPHPVAAIVSQIAGFRFNPIDLATTGSIHPGFFRSTAQTYLR
jgi:hypothetical protein